MSTENVAGPRPDQVKKRRKSVMSRLRSLVPAKGTDSSRAQSSSPKSEPPLPSDSEKISVQNGGSDPQWDEVGNAVRLDWASMKSGVRHCLSLPRSVLISSFFINFLGLALPLSILQVYDRILPNKATDTLVMLIIGLSIVVLLEGFMKVARSQVMSWAALKAGYAGEVDAVSRYLRAKQQDVSKDAAAIWIDRLDALTQLNGFYGGPARLILLDLPFVVIFFAVIALVGGPLVLVPVAVIACFAGHTALSGKHLQDLYAQRSEQDSRRYDFIVECLKGIQSIKSMAMEPAMQRRFERLQRSSASISYQMIIHSNAMQSSGSLFANISMVAIVTVGALAVMSGYLSLGALACCSLLSGRVVQPVLKGISVWSELQNVNICQQRARPLFSLSRDTGRRTEEREIKGAVTLRDIHFEREGDDALLFTGLSLSVQPGQIVGFRGADGSGRTSLLNMVRGEVTPDSGSVHVDGLNVFGPAYQQIGKTVCYVGTGAPIFRGSVIENITMFRSGEVMQQAREAARLIGLEDDIHALPEGYDTMVGEGVADTLPGGLQQRIGIARVLVGAPRILLFDEANSMVDMESDKKLREGLAILKGHMTIMIASNRPSFLSICDAVYELHEGRLSLVLPNGKPISSGDDDGGGGKIVARYGGMGA